MRACRTAVCTIGAILPLLLTLLMPQTGSAAGAGATDWPKYHFDLGNTGYNPNEAVLNASNVGTLKEDWLFPAKDRVDSPAAVAGGVAYFGSELGDGRTYAVDTATGTQIWSRLTPGGYSVQTGPAVSSGLVYVGAYGALYALNAVTGKIRWKLTSQDYFNSPAIASGIVYDASGDTLYARDARTGKEVWTVRPGGSLSLGAVAIANGTVYVSEVAGALDALNATTGEVLWSVPTAYNPSSPVIVGKTVIVGAGRTAYGIDAADGSTHWSKHVNWILLSDPASFGGLVYFGAAGKHVVALKTTNGHKAWTFLTAGSPVSVTGANGLLYVGCTNDHNLYMLDAASGELVSTYPTDVVAGSGPTIVNGHVYFGDFVGFHELGLP
jgi:outer membrane protein assembly factor BamB